MQYISEDGEYMSFGISGHPERSQMVGGDVAVAWVNKTTLKGYSEDYYLDAKSQCAGVHGSCPDETFAVSLNFSTALARGYISIILYQYSRGVDDSSKTLFLFGF